jgi:hypothetical protein
VLANLYYSVLCAYFTHSKPETQEVQFTYISLVPPSTEPEQREGGASNVVALPSLFDCCQVMFRRVTLCTVNCNRLGWFSEKFYSLFVVIEVLVGFV